MDIMYIFLTGIKIKLKNKEIKEKNKKELVEYSLII